MGLHSRHEGLRSAVGPVLAGLMASVLLAGAIVPGNVLDMLCGKTLTYPVSAPAAYASFIQTGQFSFDAPDLGTVTIDGVSDLPAWRTNPSWWVFNGSSLTYGGPDRDLPMHGEAVGYDGSFADILIGEYALYGEVLLPRVERPGLPPASYLVILDLDEGIVGDRQEVTVMCITPDWLPCPKAIMNILEGATMDSGTGTDSLLRICMSAVSEGYAIDLTGVEAACAALGSGPDEEMPPGSPTSGMKAVCLGEPCTPSDSEVQMHATQGFADSYSGTKWKDRIATAFAKYTPMFKFHFCIHLVLKDSVVNPTDETILKSDNCYGDPSVVKDYQNWLLKYVVYPNNDPLQTTETYPYPEAYQLWTAKDLEMTGTAWNDYASCFGLGAKDIANHWREAALFPDGYEYRWLAASVVEGYDYQKAGDYYDPDEVKERGIVSGHELVHIYGEDNHPESCGSPGNCHIMRNGVDPEARGFFVLDSTEVEVAWRFHCFSEPGWDCSVYVQ